MYHLQQMIHTRRLRNFISLNVSNESLDTFVSYYVLVFNFQHDTNDTFELNDAFVAKTG